MWDRVILQQTQPETTYLFEFCEQLVSGPFAEDARAVFEAAEANSPALHTFRITPQSPPHHSEGPTVFHNIIRTLAGLFALSGDVSLLAFEEFAREKTRVPEVIELQNTMRAEKTLLEVFVLTHDIGKPDTISFDAPNGSLGEREGFSQHKRRLNEVASVIERSTYEKLFKAFTVRHEAQSPQELTAGFYDKYEIRVHYNGHAKQRVVARHETEIRRIADRYQLSQDDQELLLFLIEHHMQAVAFGTRGIDPLFYRLVIARAETAGLDANRALNVLLAALFLDGTIGTLHYEDGAFSLDLRAVTAMIESERAVASYRVEARREQMALAERKRLKRVLNDAGLAAETVFALLRTPFGPERGRLMQEVEHAVREPAYVPVFPSHQTELMARVTTARSAFDGARIA